MTVLEDVQRSDHHRTGIRRDLPLASAWRWGVQAKCFVSGREEECHISVSASGQ